MQVQSTHWQPFSALYPSVALWKHKLLSSVAWWSCGLTEQWTGPAGGEQINDSGGQDLFFSFLNPGGRWKKCQCLWWLVYVLSAVSLCVCKQDPEVCQGSGGASSLSAAGGSAGLLEVHGFAQPAGEVHSPDFWSFDECVILKENEEKPMFTLLASLAKY